MANEAYKKAWEGARLDIKKVGSFEPIACITSRNETNTTNTSEKTNVCTQGKTVTKATSISRTVSIEGEMVDQNSYKDLKTIQNSLEEQVFRTYQDEETFEYFKGIITELSGDWDVSEEGADATFSMSIQLNGDYSYTDPSVTP